MIFDTLLLADFSVIKPDFGLFFWATVFFLLFWFLVGKAAFKPIANALKKRENDIQDALDEAKRAREEMANLNARNEQLLVEAREERAKMMREAKEAGAGIVNDARDKAKEEAQRIVMNAKRDIENEKKAAITELKNQVGNMAIEIAEKVLQRELDNKQEQEQFVSRLVDDIRLN